MANGRNAAKDVYFGLLGYDIEMYAKYPQNLSRKLIYGKFMGKTGGKGSMSDQ